MTRLIVSDIETKISCLRIEPRNYVDNTDPGDWHFEDDDAPPSIIRLAAYPVDILVPGSNPPYYYIGTGGDDKTTLNLSDTPSPTTIELTGVLGIGGITRDLILMKYFEGAKVYFFATCWNNFVQDEEPYGLYLWGKTSIEDESFTVELTHISDLLKQDVSKSYTKLCTNIFDDRVIDQRGTTPIPGIGRCNPDGEALETNSVDEGTITQVISTISFRDDALGGELPDDWYGNGQITFHADTMSHGRDQRVFEIVSYTSDGTFVLAEPPLLGGILEGMTYRAIAGCRKRFTEDCKGKHDNSRNFFGFDNMPNPSQSGEIGNLSG